MKKIDKLNEIGGFRLSIEKVTLSRYNCLDIQGLEIEKKGFFIRISKIKMQVHLRQLVKNTFDESLKIKIESINVEKIQQHKNSKPPRPENAETSLPGHNWEVRYYVLFKQVFDYLFRVRPDVYVQSTVINIKSQLIYLCDFRYVNDLITAQVGTSLVNANAKIYIIEGTISRRAKTITFKVACSNPIHDSSSAFHVDNCFFLYREETNQQLKTTLINITAKLDGLIVENTRIGNKASTIDTMEFDLQIKFNADCFLISEESGGSINDVPFAFELIHDTKESDLIKAVFYIEIDGSHLLRSFPHFHNENIRTLNAQGKMTLKFSLMFLIDNPFNHFFDIKILNNNIVISDAGKFDLSYLATDYGPVDNYINNTSSRIFELSPITALEIDPTFLKVVVFTEDPNFYDHIGIDPYSVGFAIVSNIANRKFSRGASTITMQVVRNLFLTHNKTILRKLEEAIIALLIENHFRIPKQRLLEIYLNIIEFGPNVYGIGGASELYFSKKPADLSLLESLVISYVIPRPIHFYNALLQKTPQLLINLPAHVKQMSQGLLRRNLITADEYTAIESEIQFANDLGTISLN